MGASHRTLRRRTLYLVLRFISTSSHSSLVLVTRQIDKSKEPGAKGGHEFVPHRQQQRLAHQHLHCPDHVPLHRRRLPRLSRPVHPAPLLGPVSWPSPNRPPVLAQPCDSRAPIHLSLNLRRTPRRWSHRQGPPSTPLQARQPARLRGPAPARHLRPGHCDCASPAPVATAEAAPPAAGRRRREGTAAPARPAASIVRPPPPSSPRQAPRSPRIRRRRRRAVETRIAAKVPRKGRRRRRPRPSLPSPAYPRQEAVVAPPAHRRRLPL